LARPDRRPVRAGAGGAMSASIWIINLVVLAAVLEAHLDGA
jgi:hypothetical protein